MPAVAPDVVILCVTGHEAYPVRMLLDDAREIDDFECFRAWTGWLGKWQAMLMHCAEFGQDLAAAIDLLRGAKAPRLAINFGAAGALHARLPIGTPTLPRMAAAYDADPPRIIARREISFPPGISERLPGVVPTQAGSMEGTVSDDALRDRIAHVLGLDTTDWETHALAARCAESGISFVALRCVTDRCGSEAHREYGRHAREVLDRCAPLLESLADILLEGSQP